MTHNLLKKAAALILITTVILGGCGQKKEPQDTESPGLSTDLEERTISETDTNKGTNETEEIQTESNVQELAVRFGDNKTQFMMHMENNETAEAIARYVGTSDWRLPIYESDDDVNYDVMQYYDIPNRYDIPSNPETVTSEKAGDVFYSHPNRIILFYRDAEIPGEYTKIGTFDPTDEFINAVEENPVLEGWGNKIVQISRP